MRTLAVIAACFAALAYISFTRETKKPDAPSARAGVRSTRRSNAKRPPASPVRVKKSSTPQNLNAMALGGYPPVVYRFQGRATCEGRPCANTQVTVRVIAGKRIHTVGGVTGTDGLYAIPVTVSVPVYAPVEWAIEAHTADYQQVELTGRRITTEEDAQDGRVTLEGALVLL